VSPRLVGTCALAALFAAACSRPDEPLRLPPVVVVAEYRLAPVVLRGPTRAWWKNAAAPAHFGDPMPVGVTMYCLQGRTRRGRLVQPGIAAADPRYFPLAQSIELYVGRKYIGRFLIDDTGKRVIGDRIDVWTADCELARRFGLQRGLAVRVRGEPQVRLSGSATPAETKPRP
jgi:3D (Asp-Asp-Asp) domain-containing protein